MRLLHPRTLEIIVSRDDIPKAHISRVWSELFKWLASGQSHPKMFIDDRVHLGGYMRYVYDCGCAKGCNLDNLKMHKFGKKAVDAFMLSISAFNKYFDDNYLFSDAVSLYFKGVNIFPDIFGDEWRRYVPIQNLKEILRVVQNTLEKS
jgi:hypothetical protein